MEALDHQIRSAGKGFFRKIRMKPKMCPMGLIHNEDAAPLMDAPGNPPDIGNHAVIRRGSEKHSSHIACLPHGPLHLLRKNASVNPPDRIHFRI